MPFAYFDPEAYSWKMSQLSLLEESTGYLQTWPRAGSMRSGTAYQRPPSAPLTAATAYSLSRIAPTLAQIAPTPTATDAANSRRASAVRRKEWVSNDGTTLLDFADPTNGGRLLPTVLASDARSPGPSARRQGGQNLAVAVSLLPTPTTQDASNNGGPSQHHRNSKPLNAEVGGALNPRWVEWLMGFPDGWTDCDASATPSCQP